MGSIFSPYDVPQVGGSPAATGLSVVALLELQQVWSAIHRPARKLLNICACLFVLFVLGTLPQINMFSNLAGFVFGILLAILFLPNLKQSRCHSILKSLSFVILAVGFLITLVVFYEVQFLRSCSVCSFLNCIPYAPDVC